MSTNWVKVGREIVNRFLKENEHRTDEILAGIEGERFHTFDTNRLVLLLSKNKASEALQIAAMAHDCERFTVQGAGRGFRGKRLGKAYEQYKKKHAKKGAAIIANELKKRKAPKSLIEKVTFLVSHHDDTIDEIQKFEDKELEILIAADTLSWLNFSAPNYFNGKEKKGIAGLIDKMDFMLSKLPEKFWKYIPEIKLSEPRVIPYLKERMKIIAAKRGIIL